MSEQNPTNEEQVQALYAFVAEKMKEGVDKAGIAAALQEQGMERSAAEQAVDGIHREISEAVKREEVTGGSIVPALAGGLAGALVGGAVWAGIAMATDYEIGIVAWGIGALCGYLVVLFTGGSRGPVLQVIAVVSSVFGIVAGKYFTFYYFLKQMFVEEQGAEAVEGMSVFSTDVMQWFVQAIPDMASPWDLLWIVLAVATAWGIPRGSGIKLNQSGPIG